MRTTNIFSIVAAAAVMTGCFSLPSVHPLYTGRNQVFDPTLLGAWTDKSGHDVLTVRRSREKAYRVLYSSKPNHTSRYEAHLVELERFRFLDVEPKTNDSDVIPGHYFAKLWMENQELRIAFMDSDWLLERLAHDSSPVHELRSQRENKKLLVLTAPTEDLQKFVLRYAREPKAFDDTLELRRMN